MTNPEPRPISRDEIEAKYNTTAATLDYRNPYLNALGYIAGGVIALGLLIALFTMGAYGGPIQGLSLAAFGLGLGLLWLVAGAIVHAVRSTVKRV